MNWLWRGIFFCLLLLATAPFWVAWASFDGERTRAPIKPASRSAPRDEAPSAVEADCLPEQYVVRVTGREFLWHFDVLNAESPRSTKSRLSESVLELPAGVPIRWEVTSDDYIYWLRVPELDVNVMAVPDLTFEAVTEQPEPVELDLLVDPLCGFRFYHDQWMGRIELRASESK